MSSLFRSTVGSDWTRTYLWRYYLCKNLSKFTFWYYIYHSVDCFVDFNNFWIALFHPKETQCYSNRNHRSNKILKIVMLGGSLLISTIHRFIVKSVYAFYLFIDGFNRLKNFVIVILWNKTLIFLYFGWKKSK